MNGMRRTKEIGPFGSIQGRFAVAVQQHKLATGFFRSAPWAGRMNRRTFSKSFSKGVRNCSSLQWPSYLILFEKSHILASKTGHEPPDSDLRLQHLHSSPTTPAQRHHCTVDISAQ